MTFRPAKNDEAPQASQTPIDPAESAVEQIAESVEEARENVQEARQEALEAANSQSERDAINAHFNALNENVNEMGNRIESAISTGNAQLAATLTGFLDRLDSRLPSGGAGDSTDDDGDILSIEELVEDVADPVVGAAAATGDAIKDVVDEAPTRAHRLFRPLWGGSK